MKNQLLIGSIFCMLASAPAFANEINLDVNLGGPAVVAPAPVVMAPAPVVMAPQAVIVEQPEPVFVERPGYDPYHRDHKYWEQREAHERWVRAHNERMERERHEHHEDHDFHHDERR